MTLRATYDLRAEPTGSAYRELVAAAQECCSAALLVVRPGVALAATALAALDRLRPWLVNAEPRAVWPGTRLLSGTATVHRYRFGEETATVLAEAAGGLFDWVQPALPEDLCLLRPDGAAWLVTIAHERDGYLVLTAAERAALVARIPELALSRRAAG